MSIKKPVIILFCLLALHFAKAQSQVLEVYIQQGLKSNLQLQQEELNYSKSVQNLRLAKSLFLPQLSANSSYTWSDGGRKITIPVGDLMNPVYSTLNQLTGTNSFPQIENSSTQFLPNDFHDTKLRVIQPIFNPEIYFNYKAQKDLISYQQAQKNAYENELKFNIVSAYYQYLESEEVITILAETYTLLQQLLTLNRKLVANDKATKDVVLNAEYELDKVDQQLTEAKKNRAVSVSYFNFLLNRDLNALIEKDTTISTSKFEEYKLEELTNTALTNREEIKQAGYGMQAGDDLISLNKSSALLPKISVVGDAGYQGTQYKFNDEQRYWLVQFSLSWDIFRGGEKRAKIQQAKIDYQITENKMAQLKKQIELQVIQSYHEMNAAKSAFITSRSGIKRSENFFQIIQAKYNEGQAIMLEYLDAENKLTTARMTQVINTYELLRREAALKKTIANL
jgi:outer membrane protein